MNSTQSSGISVIQLGCRREEDEDTIDNNVTLPPVRPWSGMMDCSTYTKRRRVGGFENSSSKWIIILKSTGICRLILQVHQAQNRRRITFYSRCRIIFKLVLDLLSIHVKRGGSLDWVSGTIHCYSPYFLFTRHCYFNIFQRIIKVGRWRRVGWGVGEKNMWEMCLMTSSDIDLWKTSIATVYQINLFLFFFFVHEVRRDIYGLQIVSLTPYLFKGSDCSWTMKSFILPSECKSVHPSILVLSFYPSFLPPSTSSAL